MAGESSTRYDHLWMKVISNETNIFPQRTVNLWTPSQSSGCWLNMSKHWFLKHSIYGAVRWTVVQQLSTCLRKSMLKMTLSYSNLYCSFVMQVRSPTDAIYVRLHQLTSVIWKHTCAHIEVKNHTNVNSAHSVAVIKVTCLIIVGADINFFLWKDAGLQWPIKEWWESCRKGPATPWVMEEDQWLISVLHQCWCRRQIILMSFRTVYQPNLMRLWERHKLVAYQRMYRTWWIIH